MATKRAALLIRCSREEAEKIRETAKHQRRTVSGFVLHAVLSRVDHWHRLQLDLKKQQPPHPWGKRRIKQL